MLDDIATFRIVATAIAVVTTGVAVTAIARGRTSLAKAAVPIVGTIALASVTWWRDNITDWRLTIFGLMILFVVYYLPDGIVGFLRAKVMNRRRASTVSAAQIDEGAGSTTDPVLAAAASGPEELLKVRQLLMQFDGLKALNQVDLTVKRGTIHGLIGPTARARAR